MADFGADLELEDFRTDAAGWLKANFPASLSGKGQLAMPERSGQSVLTVVRFGNCSDDPLSSSRLDGSGRVQYMRNG